MSRKTDEGGYGSAENGGWPDETPQEEGTAAEEGSEQTAVPPAFLAIEEHAAALGVSAPVFAAVRQYRGWAEGKKVKKDEFEEAVNTFLNSPIGGSNVTECEE